MPKVNYILAFVLGFSCFIVQLVLIRLFLTMFMGNELVIGTTLALWMLLTATGAWLGHRFYPAFRKEYTTGIILVALGVFPLAGIFLAIMARDAMFIPGVMVSLQGVLLISTAGLAMFCLASGMLFTFLAAAYADKRGKKGIAIIYAIEAAGSLAGGLLFNFVLVYYTGVSFILGSVLTLHLAAAALYLYSRRWKTLSFIILLITIPAGVFIYHYDFQYYISASNYAGRDILQISETPFGELVVSSRAGQKEIFSGGALLGRSDDVVYKEEKVHYAMSLHPDPADVLMLFGGLDGSLDEVTKYNIRCIDYVEPDPWAMEAAEAYFGLSLPEGLCVHYEDPVQFIRQQGQKYDVIMLCAPPPSTIGNNRFFTSSFFEHCRDMLTEDGLLSIMLPPPGNYLDKSTEALYSGIYNSIKTSFAYIRIIPGTHCFFIASRVPVDGSITDNISTRGILTDYVNVFYINEALLDERAALIKEALDKEAPENSRMKPLAAYQSLLLWLNMFSMPVWMLILIPVLVMAVYLLRLSPYNLGMFSTGFTASAGEFLAMVVFQSLYGFIYQLAGLFIMIFMAGLVLGAGFAPVAQEPQKRRYAFNQLFLGIFPLMLPLLLLLDDQMKMTLLAGILSGVFTFAIAILTGIQFSYATKLRKASGSMLASSAYGADLAGSAFGLFMVSIFIFPLLGMWNTVIILMVVNIVVAIKISTSPP